MSDLMLKIQKYIICSFHVTSEIDAQTNLFDSRIIDSIGLIELVNFLESEFQISIPFETLSIDNFKTIEAIELLIIKKQAGN